MKTKYLILSFSFLLIGFNSEAQLLKKLKEKAEQAAERTVLKKTEEVVSQKTEEAIDGVTTGNSKGNKSNSKSGEITGSTNIALEKNTAAKKSFYKEDVVIKLHENGNLNQTQFFDAEQVAARIESAKLPKPGYNDSEGFLYTYGSDGYKKSSLIAVQGQGMMV